MPLNTHYTGKDLVRDLHTLRRNKNFMLLFFSYGIDASSYSLFVTFLNQFIQSNYTEVSTGIRHFN